MPSRPVSSAAGAARVAGAAAILAVAAAVVLTVPAVTGTRSTPAPATGTIPATVYVANYLRQASR